MTGDAGSTSSVLCSLSRPLSACRAAAGAFTPTALPVSASL